MADTRKKYKLNDDEPIDSQCLQTAFRVFSLCGYPFRIHEIKSDRMGSGIETLIFNAV
jgi:hypothetical protein